MARLTSLAAASLNVSNQSEVDWLKQTKGRNIYLSSCVGKKNYILDDSE
jgi:hypothetical protein